TGFMSWVHAEALRRLGVPVIGVCGSTPDKSAAAAKRLHVDRAYDCYDDALADPHVDTVHVATPNRFHFDMARQALVAGKHVMCEKPLAMTSIESAELVRVAAEHSHLAAGVNYNIRYYPLCLEAREITRAGGLGDVVHIAGSYAQDWLSRADDYNWRVLAEENGELRAVADVGTHWLDLVHAITGLEVESVCADLMTVHPVRRRPRREVVTFARKDDQPSETEPVSVTTDDYGAVLLRYRGGARGCLYVSQVSPGRKNCVRFELVGSQRTLAWNSERPNELWNGYRERPNELAIRDPALMSNAASAASDYPGGHNEGYADTFKQCFRSFYDGIARGDCETLPNYPTFADGHREILLCDAILQSCREDRWVSLEESS
ncbi:MAG: Gfo/Idh/MocA family oxidoreductase, partial [Planctomycetota bacterium]